ncbi:MAG: PAS domain S-box protein [Saccharospirillum sp.]
MPARVGEPPCVYLVEDDPDQALYLQQMLDHRGYQVRLFSGPEPFLLAIHEGVLPDAIVLDMVFPEGCDAGAQLLTRLRDQQPDCPPVVVISARDDFDARLKAYRAGASRYMLKPVDSEALADVLNALAGRLPSEPYRVLMVDDDPLLLEAQSLMLEAAGICVEALTDPRATLDALDQFNPDLLVLDVQMPDVQGPELAAIIRERDDYLTLPILFLSSETDLDRQLHALNLGGDDFLVKPIQPAHLVSAVRTRAKRARQSVAIQRRLQTTLYEREREHLALDYHAIVSATDAQGNIISVNDRFCEISGYRREELLGQNHRIVKSGWHSPDFYRDLWKTIGRGQVWQGEICNRRKDGSLYWVRSTITPFLNELGRPYQYVSIRTDITALKEEEVRQRAEATMKALVAEAAADLMAASAEGLDAVIESVLARVGEHLGVQRAYLFERLPDGVHMSNSHEWCATGTEPQKEQLQQLPLAMTPWWWERILNEQAIPVGDVGQLPAEAEREREVFTRLGVRALCGFPIRYAGQTQGFLGVDQVDRPRDWQASDLHMLGLLASLIGSALARRASEQRAEAAQQRLSRGQLFANIGTWEWNIVTGELFWTDRIAPLFGYPQGDLETTYENFLAAIHPDDRDAVVNAVNACIEQDSPYEIEHRVVWPDGTVRWLLERGAAVRDEHGNATSMLGLVQDIDDRKRAELALAQREQELIEAQALASLGNWTADVVSDRLSWSDEIYRIFGYEPGDITPSVSAFHEAVHPQDRALVRESERMAARTGRHDVVHRIVRPNGDIRHVHELARAEVDDAGKLLKLTGTVQDVTERIEAEQRLRETEQRFAFAVEGAGDGVWEWDMQTGAMQLTGNYDRMLGMDEADMQTTLEAWQDRVHPDDIADAHLQLKNYLTGHADQYSVELRLRCNQGDYKWLLSRARVVERDIHGKPLRLVGIHSDIDQRKAAEQTLQVFKHVVNSVVDGVLVIDGKGTIQLASPAASRIFGYPAEAMEGRNLNMLMPEPVRSQHDGFLERYRTTGESLIINRQIEVTGQHADGTEFPLEVAVSEIQLGKTRYFVGLMRDITERKRAEAELVTAREEADRANQAKSEFLSSMSHELRTPMNAILGFSQLLAYDEALSEEHQDNLKEILKAGEHLLSLINEVLDLAKVESGKVDLSLEPVSLSDVADECLSLVSSLAQQREIQLEDAIAPVLTARADRTRLKQVLLNLLSNAIKYNHDGGRVTLDAHARQPDRIRIEVTDTGPGIDPARQRELFQPFHRLDAELSGIEGTGIGLTISRRITELMGGVVGVESTPGTGSTFWIELPLEVATAPETERTPGTALTGQADASVTCEPQKTVLYIEDNPANLKLVTQIMGHIPDVHLLTAHTPSLGIELATARQPDLILLDINLPGMDGYQILEILKADARLRHIPVIAITANAMPRDVERGKAAGFFDYLTKPLDVSVFLQRVQGCLHRGLT